MCPCHGYIPDLYTTKFADRYLCLLSARRIIDDDTDYTSLYEIPVPTWCLLDEDNEEIPE
jgi:hypothetical protein